MFKQMRRKKQQLTDEESREILRRGLSGTLALRGTDGYPYSVPVSYLFDGNRLIFHGAKDGHKMDCIRRNAKASFSVVDRDFLVPEEYTTYFRSVICFGKIRIVENPKERRELVFKLAQKYRPGFEEECNAEIDKEFSALCVLVLDIEHMTGKEAIELVREKKKNAEMAGRKAETIDDIIFENAEPPITLPKGSVFTIESVNPQAVTLESSDGERFLIDLQTFEAGFKILS